MSDPESDVSQSVGGFETPLDTALDVLWQTFSNRDSLIAHLAADAVLVRADLGEFRACLPRLLELLLLDQLGDEPGFAITQRLVKADWQSWERREREALEHFFDTWWTTTRLLEDGRRTASEVLAILVQLEVPLVRWLGPWLEDFDGPPARHFADMILAEFEGPAWAAAPDAQGQVAGWAASEACVNGIVLVGGIHLPEGQLSDVLDRLLEQDGKPPPPPSWPV